jgi:hypothetical protein
MIAAVKRQCHQAVGNHFQHLSDIAKIESGFRQDCFTREQRLCHLLGHTHRPLVVRVPATGEGY